MEKPYVLWESGDWFYLTDRANKDAYITDAHRVMKFGRHQGFESAEDVLNHMERYPKYFKVKREEIEVL